MLTQEQLRSVLSYEPDTGVFRWAVSRGGRAQAGRLAGYVNNQGRRMIEVCGRAYPASRLAWLYVAGDFPLAQVDHQDRNRLNDAWVNLRLATNKQNCENKGLRRDNKSGCPGVFRRPDSGKWRAKIGHNGKQISIGCFATKAEAVQAKRAAERRLFTHLHLSGAEA
jgi:hypothetical protein